MEFSLLMKVFSLDGRALHTNKNGSFGLAVHKIYCYTTKIANIRALDLSHIKQIEVFALRGEDWPFRHSFITIYLLLPASFERHRISISRSWQRKCPSPSFLLTILFYFLYGGGRLQFLAE